MHVSLGLGRRLRTKLRGLLADRRGVAAVEFAFIVPVLLCMYLITMEASQAIEANKKVSRIGSAIADLITQQGDLTPEAVVAIMEIGKSIIQPYNRSKPAVEVTAIKLGTEPTPIAKVAWSVKLDANGKVTSVAAKDSVVTDPQIAKIRAPGAFYIRVKSDLNYEPVITWSPGTESFGLLSAFSGIHMGETYYLRPRIKSTIDCTKCP